MLTKIKEYAWLFGLIGPVVAVLLYRLNHKRSAKGLTYRIAVNASLIERKDSVKDKVTVQYDGKEVKDLSMIQLELTNTGGQPISDKDYEKPIRISFLDTVEIIEAEVIKSRPASLSPQICIEDNFVSVSPLLLNAGDSFKVQMLVNSVIASQEIKVHGRIVGINDIKPADSIDNGIPLKTDRKSVV